MRVKLTPAFVKKASAPPGGDRAVFWDEAMEGFGLLVMASGHRSYAVQYPALTASAGATRWTASYPSPRHASGPRSSKAR